LKQSLSNIWQRILTQVPNALFLRFRTLFLWIIKNWLIWLIIVFILLAIGIIHWLIDFLKEPISTAVPDKTLCTADPGSKTPLTDVRFVILTLAVTISIYISTVSRGVITSLKGDLSSTKNVIKSGLRLLMINKSHSGLY
jgi:hypothetical protein